MNIVEEKMLNASLAYLDKLQAKYHIKLADGREYGAKIDIKSAVPRKPRAKSLYAHGEVTKYILSQMDWPLQEGSMGAIDCGNYPIQTIRSTLTALVNHAYGKKMVQTKTYKDQNSIFYEWPIKLENADEILF